MKKIQKVLRLRLKDLLLLIEAYMTLGYSRFILVTTDFKKIAVKLGNPAEPETVVLTDAQKVAADKINWSVTVMSRYTFWECKCLVKAITVKLMLNRRHLPNTLYLGMAKDEKKNVSAHAWIKCGNLLLTGTAGAERFTVVSRFTT